MKKVHTVGTQEGSRFPITAKMLKVRKHVMDTKYSDQNNMFSYNVELKFKNWLHIIMFLAWVVLHLSEKTKEDCSYLFFIITKMVANCILSYCTRSSRVI